MLPAPAGDHALQRIVALTGALVDRDPPRTVVLEPGAAADEILAQLRSWGYLAGDADMPDADVPDADVPGAAADVPVATE